MNTSSKNDRVRIKVFVKDQTTECPSRVVVGVIAKYEGDEINAPEIKSSKTTASFESAHNPFVVEDGITSLLLEISDIFENIENILKEIGITIDKTEKMYKHQTEVHLFPNEFRVWGHINKSEIDVPLIAPDRKPPLSLLQNLGGYVTERIVRYLSPEGENH